MRKFLLALKAWKFLNATLKSSCDDPFTDFLSVVRYLGQALMGKVANSPENAATSLNYRCSETYNNMNLYKMYFNRKLGQFLIV